MFFSLQIDAVQTFVTKRLASYLSDELKAKVSIDHISIRFVRSIVLKGFYLEDRHGDTLVYTEELSLLINDISTSKKKLDLAAIVLKNGQFNLVQYKGEEHDNLHFISEYFSSSDTTSSGAPWKINIRKLTLDNFIFKNEIEDDSLSEKGVDFSHLLVKNINGTFSDFTNENDSLYVKINKLSFKEKSGFNVHEFSAKTNLSSTEIRLKELKILTPHTDLHTDLVFRFDSLPCFDEFTSRVNWTSDFVNTTVSFTDIAYFAPELTGLDRSVKIEGLFKGAVNNFKGRNVSLQWGSHSAFRGNVSLRGLPVIDDTYADITVDKINTNKNDLEWFPIPPFNEAKHIDIPKNLETLGEVTFKGKFTGFFSDFVAYGNINTALGSINSDLNLKYNKKTKLSEYSGHVSAYNFDAGKIALLDDLGRVTFSLNVEGSGLKFDNINAQLEGNIGQLEYKKYSYKNLAVNGEIAKKLFNGSLTVQEENVDLSFNGSIDYRNKLPEFNFNAEINTARLDVLNLFKTKDNTILQTSINSHFKGIKMDDIVGGIEIMNTNFTTGKKLYHINSIVVDARKSDKIRSFDILSDNIDAHFNGEFEIMKLGDALKEILPHYLPSVVMPQKSFFSNQNFTFDIRIKNLNVFTENAFPSWDFAPNTTLKGNLNTIENNLSLSISSEKINFGKFAFENFSMNVSGDKSELNLNTKAERISSDGKKLIDMPNLTAHANNNKIDYVLQLADQDTQSTRAHLKGSMNFFSASNFNFKIDSSLLVIENEKWKIDKNNLLVFDSSSISVNTLELSKGNEIIKINGSLGKNPEDKLGLNLSGFSLDHLNTFIKSSKTVFGGIINGNVYLTNAYTKPRLETDLNISDLSVNGDTLGNTSIRSDYDSDQDFVHSEISVVKGSAIIMDVKGKYYVKRENDNLAFTIRLNNLYLHPIERYIDDIMTDMHGKISADLELTGSLRKPIFNGTVDLNKTSLIVNYLNTRYSFSTTVKVKENEFIIDDLKIIDANNNQALANGKVYHNYFSNFRFDVELLANKFQVLNTTIKDNSLYYGFANASGYAHFKGPLDNMNMDISLSPDKGTVINIPLNTYEDLSRSNFITFINRSQNDSDQLVRSHVDLSGIKLNMNLDMNRNALINIIFDEKIGDVISGSGTGSLRLDINTSGNFNMYGTYNIEKGDYLFTLQNLINKKFNIDPGGRITWAGDPYEAIIDISAVYVVYTSTLYNVLPDDSTFKRRVPVDCRIFLSNKLMNPTINYEIGVRGLAPTEEGLVRTILNSEEQLNKQMFGLLLFNQFLPTAGTGQSITRLNAGSGAGASASELLSNQVSNWLGQISKDVNIGFNYRSADSYTNEEVKLIFSKSLLNDRLLIEGNVGYLKDQTYVNSNVVGDFYAEYKVSPDGRFRVKGFNRSNADNIINYSQAPYSQGFGIFYRQDFDTWKDLMIKLRLSHKDDENKTP